MALRLWLGIFLAYLALAPALAQLAQIGVGAPTFAGGPPGCSGAYTGIGDVQSGAVLFYGMRAYSHATCGGRSMNIRRASDNASTDILTLSTNGNFDTSTASTFCNATSCFVTKWYDQTNHSNDASNATNSAQPALTFNCINTSLPCVTWNAANSTQLNLNACSVSAMPVTVGYHADRTGNTSAFSGIEPTCQNVSNNGNGPFYVNGANTINCGFGTGSQFGSLTSSDSAWHGVECGGPATNAATANFTQDGTNNTWTGGTTTFNTGANPSIGGSFTGTTTENFVYASFLSSTTNIALCHNESLYYGTPSC